MNQSLNKMAAAILAMLCTLAASSAAEAQTRHQLKLHLPGLAVSGAAETPASQQLQLSSTAIDFGNVATHTTVKRQVLASNLGGTTLSFKAAPTVTGSEAFNAGLTSCGATLPVGAECLAEVLFSPTSVGTHSGLLSFTTSLAGSPHKVSLAANAFNPVSLAAATLPSGTVGQAYAYDFKSLLGVSNEASPDKTQATWSGSGTLPAGLTLNSSTGVLSGTPTARSAGASYTVIATYKNNQGQQVYTLQVGSDTLEVVQISAGGYHTCAITTAGAAKCWGNNEKGQLGNSSWTSSPVPVAVFGLTSGVMSVAAGAFHTCAITTAGATKCWGYNYHGELGNGTTMHQSTPVPVSGLSSGVTRVLAGAEHTCVVTTSGGAKCWGGNSQGQLGDGTTINKYVPVNVTGLSSGVANLVAGGEHTCAVTPSGGVQCWGSNRKGQLGDGTAINKYVPVNVTGLSAGVASVSTGYSHTCVVTTSGGAKCWGGNSQGQLGDGTTINKYVPVNVTGLSSGVANLVAGAEHTCAVTTSGGAKCWGLNDSGQLGDGTAINKYVPVNVTGLSAGVASVSSGYSHTCAVTTSGGVQCWGGNSQGQLGDGTATRRYVPVMVSGLMPAQQTFPPVASTPAP